MSHSLNKDKVILITELSEIILISKCVQTIYLLLVFETISKEIVDSYLN
jgi:hypothetical protein